MGSQKRGDKPVETTSRTTEPCSRGLVVFSIYEAARELFGEDGLRDVAAHVPKAVAASTIETPPQALAWYPTQYLMDLYEGVLAGPARGDDARFCAFLDRTMDLGFGRVRKALLGFVGPEGLIERAAELWRHDHTHGTLSTAKTPDRQSVRVVLRDHPFVTTPVSRRAIAEILRYALSLARGVKMVRESHALLPEASLVVHLAWE